MRLRMKAKLFVAASTLLAALLTASCLKKIETLSIRDVVEQRNELNGKRVLVRGFVVVDELDYPNFLEQIGPPSGERVTKSIDLVPGNSSIEKQLMRSNGACIIAGGVFHLYGPGTVHLGNLVSEYGQVEATSLHNCSG